MALWRCRCVANDRGAHREDCPEYETIRLIEGSNVRDDMIWLLRTWAVPQEPYETGSYGSWGSMTPDGCREQPEAWPREGR